MKKVLRISKKEGQLPQPHRTRPTETLRPTFYLDSEDQLLKDQMSSRRKFKVRKELKKYRTEGNQLQKEFDRIHPNSNSPHNENQSERRGFRSYKKQEQIINRSISVYYHSTVGESVFLMNRNNDQSRTNQIIAYPSASKKQPCISPPKPLDLKEIKQQIVAKIKQRLDLLKREKLESGQSGHSTLKLLGHLSQESPLLGQDRLYDYCLKKMNKCIQGFKKTTTKSLNKKYFQLKREGEELNKELEVMRRTIWQKRNESQNTMLGVVGTGKQLSEQRRKQKQVRKSLIKRPQLLYSSYSGPEACRQSAIEGWQNQVEEC